MKANIRQVSQEKAIKTGIEEVYLHLQAKPFERIVTHYGPKYHFIMNHSLPLINRTILQQSTHMPFIEILPDDYVTP